MNAQRLSLSQQMKRARAGRGVSEIATDLSFRTRVRLAKREQLSINLTKRQNG